MTKTTIDAVNEFKGIYFDGECGDEDHQDQVLYAKRDFGDYQIGDIKIGSGNSRHNDYWKLICSREEFNQCVEDCSNNFGKEAEPVYTQAMEDNGEWLTVGMMFNHKGNEVKALAISKEDGGSVLFQDDANSIDCCWHNDAWIKPIDTRTDSQKCDDLFNFYLKGENVSTHKSFSQAVKDGDFGDNIKWSK